MLTFLNKKIKSIVRKAHVHTHTQTPQTSSPNIRVFRNDRCHIITGKFVYRSLSLPLSHSFRDAVTHVWPYAVAGWRQKYATAYLFSEDA